MVDFERNSQLAKRKETQRKIEKERNQKPSLTSIPLSFVGFCKTVFLVIITIHAKNIFKR